MSKGQHTFKQGDAKALKAATSAGIKVKRYEVVPREGKIIIITDADRGPTENEWDAV